MNERIKELSKEAFEYALGQHPGSDEFQPIWTEKFAELIVKECGVALNPPVQNRNVISRGQAYDLIKKHFGVEE